MNVPRLKLLALAVGLAAAGPAFGYTLTVGSRAASFGGAGTVVDELVTGLGTTQDVGPAGAINCVTGSTANCSGTAANASDPVLLRATPAVGSVFAGWSGCPNALSTYQSQPAGNLCLLPSGSANKAVTAYFKPGQYTVTVNAGTLAAVDVAGQLSGASPCAIGASCAYVFAAGTNATLTVTAPAGSTLSSFSGTSCTASPCTFAVTSNKTVSPVFAVTTRTFFVGLTMSGATAEANIAAPASAFGAAINCGGGASACSTNVESGTSITLTATPTTGYSVVWNGCTTFTATTCTVANVTGSRAVAANVVSGQVSCAGCHPSASATHGPNVATLNCTSCHPAGTSPTSAPSTGHNDGRMDGAPTPVPTSDGFNVQILDVTGLTTTAGSHPVVRAKFTDNAGRALDMAAYFSQGQFRRYWALTNNDACAPNSNPCSSGDTRTYILGPRVGILRLNADGTVNQMLVSALTSATASSTETLNVNGSQFAAVGAGTGVYDITLASFLPDSTNTGSTALNRRELFTADATYRAVFIGGRWSGLYKNDPMFVSAGNATFDFRPDGGPKVSHEIVTDGACQACHGKFKLNFHGNIRVGAQTCKACHYDGYYSNGPDSIRDMGYQNFVHRLHNGEDMFSVTATGFAGRFGWDGVNGTREQVKMAPSHQLYFEGGNTAIPAAAPAPSAPATAVIDPELTIDCETCHKGPDANVWQTASKKACGSCHSMDWANATRWTDPSTNTSVASYHPATYTDADCATCHPKTGALDLDFVTHRYIAPVSAVHGKFFEPAHKFDFRSLPDWPAGGYDFQVKLVSVTVASNKPTFIVDMFLNGQPFDPNLSLSTTVAGSNNLDQFGGRLATCAFQIAGPTTDYTVPATGGTAQSCTAKGGWSKSGTQPGRYQFTATSGGTFFSGKADGFYTVSFEIMWQRVALSPTGKGYPGGDWIRKPFSANPNFLTVKKAGSSVTLVTDPLELAFNDRRQVVDFDKCNNCHQDLGFHSNRGRKGPDYCATCHNPKLDNSGRARYKVAEARAANTFDASFGTDLTYLPESVSLNVFIHRIHMGEELPSVSGLELTPGYASTVAALANKWVQEPGVIKYGATRSAYVGVDATTKPDISDFSRFLMPNPMIRCDQCHISNGAQQTWALNEGTGLAPIERQLKKCVPASDPALLGWDTPATWCNNDSNAGPANYMDPATASSAILYTPPLKAVCTSCHDSQKTFLHADEFTANPNKANATEFCASCHGGGKALDSLRVHQKLP